MIVVDFDGVAHWVVYKPRAQTSSDGDVEEYAGLTSCQLEFGWATEDSGRHVMLNAANKGPFVRAELAMRRAGHGARMTCILCLVEQ